MSHPGLARRQRGDRLCVILVVAAASLGSLDGLFAADEAEQRPVEFNRDIQPILSDHCYACHGPDAGKRKADLRLDVEEVAFADRGGYAAIVPEKSDESELYLRVSSDDADYRMPPPAFEKDLAPEQVERLRRWIDEGARWQKHWAFLAPVAPAFPQVSDPSWLRTGVDAFVLARLDTEGLGPSPEADKETLIRRVTLDLTGLPPTPDEMDAFLADRADGAYDRLVDRLLDSPRYGEQMASHWLDGARYADTNGYQTDGPREMWRWRDWVVDAFNRNMPFDQFTIEQLAGDLLPDPTLDQLVATGFNRNHRGNAEGGIIPEEYAVEYVVDRVETTFTVWLGLTMGCGRCHDHKYDPLTQKEFYQVFAFFNNVPENGRAVKYGNSPPMIKAPTTDQQRQLQELEARLSAAQEQFDDRVPLLESAEREWEASAPLPDAADWSPPAGLVAHYPLDHDTADTSGTSQGGAFHDGGPAYTAGQLGGAARFDGRRFVDAGDVAKFGFYDKFSLGAWVRPETDQGGVVLSRMTDDDRADGYSLQLVGGKLHVNLVKRWLDDAIRVETVAEVPSDRWTHVAVTYDGSRVADGIGVYFNGEPQKLQVNLDELNQSFESSEPLRIGGGAGPEGRFHGCIDDVRIYHDCLKPDDAMLLATPDPIAAIVATAPENRTPAQASKLRSFYLANHAPEEVREAWQDVLALRRAKERLIEGFPTTMVMQEMPTPRETFVLTRGQYDKPAERVGPGVPAVFLPIPEPAAKDRLGFARWLVDPANPLTARVAVNRYWQMYFGDGLVKTVEDYGSQGDRPSHPDLLDWLAAEFVRTGWDVKRLQKTLVTSATYRQSSGVAPELLARDPENRLLARGPRVRLSAAMVRDQALVASGLLVESLGGPSVKPYQPEGLWEEVSDTKYEQDHGDKLYRRSLYTYWKRTAAPPTMMTFDASARETCTVRESRTNTPLQALALMNDVTFVEASRKLAERMMTESAPEPEHRIAYGFRLATSRLPGAEERAVLLEGFRRHLADYRNDPSAAEQLLSAGESPRDKTLDTGELAAYTAIANLILNLDEVITKQ